ncbi:uncharacterized protein LOC122311114 [Carya illinoinensis]|uniref:DUF7036 domain-containing protein n=1 Tax=Carya illinoinensis TaxID=32201 RepID=A0A8T1QEH3_CARIL|nr:uncharacterized protein LOC122311114 [Carya illinoinensis]KAG6653000.1 hypothetical protein CIPAW_05G043900 [Carya illinoinensis]
MGKSELQNLHRQQNHEADSNRDSSGLFCDGCSVAFNGVVKAFSIKCFFVLILTLSVLVSGVFWILPFHSTKFGFEAKDEIKLSATVQAYFRLDKPVSNLVPHIGRLEYDIYGEIGVPGMKVAILSMNQSGASNWTDVVFGVLSDPINVPITSVPLSVLRSSVIDLFLQQSNLTLTSSIFGKATMFEILKFPGGLTLIPVQSASIWQTPQIQFNFTLNNSISDILENFIELKYQLKMGLYLMSHETLYIQITNKVGSTIAAPVTVQASVMSDLGSLLPQRLKQLAEIITGSPAKNLGLNNTVFGKVKSISLSSYLKGILNVTPPSPSPAPSPSPELGDYSSSSPYPALSSHSSPTSSPNIKHRSTAHPPRPCLYRRFTNSPSPSLASHYNPAVPPAFSPSVATPNSPHMGPTFKLSPDLSPKPKVSYAPSPGQDKARVEGLVSPSLAPSPSSLAAVISNQKISLLGFSGLLIFHLFCWSDDTSF